MTKFDAGTVIWAADPTNAHDERPVIVLSHANRPYNSVDCTVMCIGTPPKQQYPYTPTLTEDTHYTGITLSDDSYLMPYALYTIPPGALKAFKGYGTLTDAGETLVKKGLVSLLSV